jgi:hypothetical protein
LDTMEQTGTSSVSLILPTAVDADMIVRLKAAFKLQVGDWNDYVSETYLIRKVTDPNSLLFLYPPSTFIAFEVLKGSSNKLFLNVIWSGGKDIVKALPEFNDIADDLCLNLKCEWVEMTGRVGWKRILAPLGFKESVVTLRREPAHVLRRRNTEGTADN